MVEISDSTNPVFRTFPQPAPSFLEHGESLSPMRLAGVARKDVILTLWTSICAVWIWNSLEDPGAAPFHQNLFLALMLISAFVPFGLVALSLWRPSLSPYTAPVYAMLQGSFFGFVAFALEPKFHHAIMQELCLTFAISIALACAYGFGLVHADDPLKKKMLFALGGTAFYFALSAALQAIGIHIFPLVLTGTGLTFCAIVFMVATRALVAGFDIVSGSAGDNYPDYMEWHAAFGLTIDLVWLYLEGIRIFFRDRVPHQSGLPASMD